MKPPVRKIIAWHPVLTDHQAYTYEALTYQSGLPANGSMELPAPCTGDTQTYYVIAHGTGGATATKSATTNGI